MTDRILAGVLARRLPGWLPHSRLEPVKLQDMSLELDSLGIPIWSCKKGAEARALRISGLDGEDVKRLEHLRLAYGYAEVELMLEDGRCVLAPTSTNAPQPQCRDSGLIFETVMNTCDAREARVVVLGAGYRAATYPLAAKDKRPHQLTYEAKSQDVEILARDVEALGFYSFEGYEFTHKRFDGGWSEKVRRELLVSGDAAVVLPYDPQRDEIVLIEQIRPAALARGSHDAWELEAVAGLIGEDEAPSFCAERELEEEAGLKMLAHFELPACYQSPGSVSQFMYLFIAHVDLEGYQTGLHGLDHEQEDIRTHIVSRKKALALLHSGEINNAPLQILLYALQCRYEEISNAMLAQLREAT